jgi:hypothetical protein
MQEFLKWLAMQLYWMLPVVVLHYHGMVAFLLAVIVSILVFTLQHVVNPQ